MKRLVKHTILNANQTTIIGKLDDFFNLFFYESNSRIGSGFPPISDQYAQLPTKYPQLPAVLVDQIETLILGIDKGHITP